MTKELRKDIVRTFEGGGWLRIHNLLFDADIYPTHRKPYLIAVYGYLARCADSDEKCFPSQDDIARKTGMSVRMVKTVIRDLATRQMVVIDRKRSGMKTQNSYRLTHTREWRVHRRDGASRARDAGHHVPPNKTQENKTNKYNFENARHDLIAKMQISANGKSP